MNRLPISSSSTLKASIIVTFYKAIELLSIPFPWRISRFLRKVGSEIAATRKTTDKERLMSQTMTSSGWINRLEWQSIDVCVHAVVLSILAVVTACFPEHAKASWTCQALSEPTTQISECDGCSGTKITANFIFYMLAERHNSALVWLGTDTNEVPVTRMTSQVWETVKRLPLFCVSHRLSFQTI